MVFVWILRLFEVGLFRLFKDKNVGTRWLERVWIMDGIEWNMEVIRRGQPMCCFSYELMFCIYVSTLYFLKEGFLELAEFGGILRKFLTPK